MFFSENDLHDNLKLSLESLRDCVLKAENLKEKRKAAKDLATIIMQIVKLESDKEDWETLLQSQSPPDMTSDDGDDDLFFDNE